MSNEQIPPKAELLSVFPKKIPEAITEAYEDLFDAITSNRLTEAQAQRVASPPRVFHQQTSVLAIHWHPEFVPMALIDRRIEAMYPGKRHAMIVPTQHNEITSYGDHAGVEVDGYSRGFNQGVQLLLHFVRSRLEKADLFKSILAHTFKYRSSQLFEFMYTITKPAAARETGADDNLIQFVRLHVQKISRLPDSRGTIPIWWRKPAPLKFRTRKKPAAKPATNRPGTISTSARPSSGPLQVAATSFRNTRRVFRSSHQQRKMRPMADYGSFEYASYQDLETIQKFLESLTQGFSKEQIVLSSGDDTIELHPKNLLKFSVSAKKKEDKTKLSIKISWKEGKIKAAKAPLEIGP